MDHTSVTTAVLPVLYQSCTHMKLAVWCTVLVSMQDQDGMAPVPVSILVQFHAIPPLAPSSALNLLTLAFSAPTHHILCTDHPDFT
jgi:hypothetical protein